MPLQVIINPDDPAEKIGAEIWKNFNVHQSVTIPGDKGKQVISRLRELDAEENKDKMGRYILKKFGLDTIGGYKATKVFKFYERHGSGTEHVWTIMRLQ